MLGWRPARRSDTSLKTAGVDGEKRKENRKEGGTFILVADRLFSAVVRYRKMHGLGPTLDPQRGMANNWTREAHARMKLLCSKDTDIKDKTQYTEDPGIGLRNESNE
jgi:hypothetical protein